MSLGLLKIQLPKADFKKFGKLPGKPSELIRLATNDIIASEKAGMRVEMSSWLTVEAPSARKAKTCTVCFAGAVMAQTLAKTPASKSILKHKGQKLTAADKKRLGDFSYGPEEIAEVDTLSYPNEKPALQALNSFRSGEIEEGFEQLGLDFPSNLLQYQVDVTGYNEDKKLFKAQMFELADSLERVGY